MPASRYTTTDMIEILPLSFVTKTALLDAAVYRPSLAHFRRLVRPQKSGCPVRAPDVVSAGGHKDRLGVRQGDDTSARGRSAFSGPRGHRRDSRWYRRLQLRADR